MEKYVIQKVYQKSNNRKIQLQEIQRYEDSRYYLLVVKDENDKDMKKIKGNKKEEMHIIEDHKIRNENISQINNLMTQEILKL